MLIRRLSTPLKYYRRLALVGMLLMWFVVLPAAIARGAEESSASEIKINVPESDDDSDEETYPKTKEAAKASDKKDAKDDDEKSDRKDRKEDEDKAKKVKKDK